MKKPDTRMFDLLRGPVTWRDWKKAEPPVRVRHNVSGATGTVEYISVPPANRSVGALYVRVRWDNGYEGRVSAPAYDLTPLNES